ncbi:MAG: response regulator [Spirochaetes bacterium]|jgi:DNA-binding NarL/FixJ family response regulator|nr:response regulator [Spirochaetota bacterium]
MIRVLVVDDHEVVRRGVVGLLERRDDLVVCGQAGTADEAIRLCEEHRPNVVLLDLRLGGSLGSDGIDLIEPLRRAASGTRVLMLSAFAEPDEVRRAIAAGVDGYILKDADGTAIVKAVREVAAGTTVLAEAVRELSSTGPGVETPAASPAADSGALERLGPRERQVLALVAVGKLNKEIAAELGLAEKTVRNLTTAIFRKLGVSNRTEASRVWYLHQSSH